MRAIIGGLLFIAAFFARSDSYAQREYLTVHPNSRYSVEGLLVGGQVAFGSREYKQYQCRQSDTFASYMWCVRNEEKRDRQGRSYRQSTSIAHDLNGTVAYINKTLRPAFLSNEDVQNEVIRLTKHFQEKPALYAPATADRVSNALIAVWGDIRLERLNATKTRAIASGEQAQAGLLLDFLGNLKASAERNAPIFKLTGGQGFVWMASRDDPQQDVLRFFAADPSRMALNNPVATTPPEKSPPPLAPPNNAAPPPKDDSSGRRVHTGTGFFISSEGHVLTNAHVVEGCSFVNIRVGIAPRLKGQPLSADKHDDLALVKADVRSESYARIRPGVRVGEGVAAFGYPLHGVLATTGNFTLGNVSAVAGLGDDSRFLQISAPVQPGNSGGPLLDQQGNVVGIVVAKLDAIEVASIIHDVPQNVNFAIKGNVVANFLESRGLAVPIGTSMEQLTSADLADRARSISAYIECQP